MTLLSTAVTLLLSSPVPVKARTYCTGSPFSVPVKLASPCAVFPCWLLSANVPVRLTVPSASQGLDSRPARLGTGRFELGGFPLEGDDRGRAATAVVAAVGFRFFLLGDRREIVVAGREVV